MPEEGPAAAELRQFHLIHAELHDQLAAAGFQVRAGDMGENITTRGIDLLALPTGAHLEIGSAVIEFTGLRNPCYQLDDFEQGLMQSCLDHAEDGSLVRLACVMGLWSKTATCGRATRSGVLLPVGAYVPLQAV